MSDKLTFKQWLGGMQTRPRREMRKRLMEEVPMSRGSLDKYLQGYKVPVVKQKAINAIAGQDLDFPVVELFKESSDDQGI